MSFKLLFSLILLAVLASCKYEFPEPIAVQEPTSNQADFSNLIVIGSSNQAGYMDGALYNNGESNSVGKLLSQQFYIVSDNTFNIPSINSRYGFNTQIIPNENNRGRYELWFNQNNAIAPDRLSVPGEPISLFNEPLSNIQNLSIPGFRLVHFNQAGHFDLPHAARFGQQLNSKSLTDYANDQNASFYVIDSGLDDILGYALAGGSGTYNPTGIVSDYQINDATAPGTFANELSSIINGLGLDGSNSTKNAVIANIPDITDFPYFHSTYYDITPYIDNSQLARNRAYVTTFNEIILQYNNQPNLEEDKKRPFLDLAEDRRGNWGIVIVDPELEPIVGFEARIAGRDTVVTLPSIRHMTPNELVVYEVTDLLGIGDYGLPLNPVPNNQSLTMAQINNIKQRIDEFNQILESLINSQNNLALADIYSESKKLHEGRNRSLRTSPPGILINGLILRPNSIENGAFSADGIHFNPRGNAWFANIILKSINDKFEGTLPLLDVNTFRGNFFENNF
ncbi:hypothetical protein ACFCT7_08400 [Fulvivirgaceae bacterium LMO-SS25]